MPTEAIAPSRPTMSMFERYLSVWVALCIVTGIGLGAAIPDLFAAIASAEVARVNLAVAALVWLMIIPMLLKIDFGALGQVRRRRGTRHCRRCAGRGAGDAIGRRNREAESCVV